MAFTRRQVAHPQEDDHTDIPLQDPEQLRGSVLRKQRDPDQKVAEGSRNPGI